VIVYLHLSDPPFHNFEHASHVTMSVVKLLTRIVAAPTETEHNLDKKSIPLASGSSSNVDSSVTFATDILAQFACVFAALIYDVGHMGSNHNNTGLMINDPMNTVQYNHSATEHHRSRSMDIAWSLLMLDQFDDLRDCMAPNDHTLARFRRLLQHTVFAFDRIKPVSKSQCFSLNDGGIIHETASTSPTQQQKQEQNDDCMATRMVLEQLIQVSNMAHTMQHWNIYMKWNERLFQEQYQAYITGGSTSSSIVDDPSHHWYESELHNFDEYIIPLAQQLIDCPVFDISSTEYLGYAIQNRREWFLKGQDEVVKMMANIQESSNDSAVLL
jgi:hypothetical protein